MKTRTNTPIKMKAPNANSPPPTAKTVLFSARKSLPLVPSVSPFAVASFVVSGAVVVSGTVVDVAANGRFLNRNA